MPKPPDSVSHHPLLLLRFCVIAGAVAVAGCTAPSTSSTVTSAVGVGTANSAGTAAGGSQPAGVDPSLESLPSISSLKDLAQKLNDNGVTCALQYEALNDEGSGKKELSLCTIEGELATLTIWNSSTSVAKLVKLATASGDPVAYGQQWTVTVDEAPLAKKIATALGGRSVPA